MLASGCELKITNAWDTQFNSLRAEMRIASYFLIRDKGNMYQSLCEGEEHTETTRKDMWVMTLTFKNLPFLSVSAPWWAHGFLIEAAQTYPLHSRSFSLWHLPRDGKEPGKVANNSLRLTASESQMSSILNHLLLTYFFFLSTLLLHPTQRVLTSIARRHLHPLLSQTRKSGSFSSL